MVLPLEVARADFHAATTGAGDIAGTDAGVSVRVPASFCGLYGIRPTHGRIDVTGMLPQAPTSEPSAL